MSIRLLTVGIFLTVFSGYAIQELLDWPVLAWSGIHVAGHIDLAAVLGSADCYKEIGLRIYDPPVSGDLCTGYIYGRSLVYLLSTLGLGAKALAVIWTLLSIAFLAVISRWAAEFLIMLGKFRGFASALFLFATLFSPPFLLLVERGNIDILIMILIAGSAWLLAVRRPIWAILPLLVATLIKFYTLPLLLIFTLFSRSTKVRWFSASGFIVGLLAVLRDLVGLKGAPGVGFAQFGLTIWHHYLEMAGIATTRVAVSGITIVAIIAVGIWAARLEGMKSALDFQVLFSTGKWVSWFGALSASTFVICYLAGLSFDYRLTYLALGGAYLITYSGVYSHRVFKYELFWVFFIALWGSCLLGLRLNWLPFATWKYFVIGIQVAGDLGVQIFASILLGLLFSANVPKLFRSRRIGNASVTLSD
jgi:hypothetical protein